MSDGRLRAEFELAGDLFPDQRAAVHLFRQAEWVGRAGVPRITLSDAAKPGPSPT